MKNELRVFILKKVKEKGHVPCPKKLHSNFNSLMNFFILFDFIMLFDFFFILFQMTYLSVAKRSEIFA